MTEIRGDAVATSETFLSPAKQSHACFWQAGSGAEEENTEKLRPA